MTDMTTETMTLQERLRANAAAFAKASERQKIAVESGTLPPMTADWLKAARTCNEAADELDRVSRFASVSEEQVEAALVAHMATFAEQDRRAGRPLPADPTLNAVSPEAKREMMEAMRAALTAASVGGGDDAEDAANWRALMACPRIRMYGSASVNPKTGERNEGEVHFGADFWSDVAVDDQQSGEFSTQWGKNCLKALAAAIRSQKEPTDGVRPADDSREG